MGTSGLGCSSVVEYMADTAEAVDPFQQGRGSGGADDTLDSIPVVPEQEKGILAVTWGPC